MKAVSGALPKGDGWAFEIKWDGMRCLVGVSDGVVAHSSRGNEIAHRFPELEDLQGACAGLDVVLDGEIVALDESGLPSFGRLQGRMHLDRPHDIERKRRDIPIVFVAFDLLHLDGNDTAALAYDDRTDLLAQVLQPGDSWQVATIHHDDGAGLLAAVGERAMEGIMAKRRSSSYLPGRRSGDWVKVKSRRRQEFVVGGWLSGEGGRAGSMGALLLGYHDPDGLRFAGRVGSGLSEVAVARLMAILDPAEADTSPFVDAVTQVPGRTITFVRPDAVVEVEFGEWTSDNHLRHPVYLGQRADGDAASVVREPDPAPVAES
jgi:bifunctional non-homologous end joining protein LigD